MAASVSDSSGELPGWFRAIVVPIAGTVLVLFFLLQGFPYDAVSNRIVSSLEASLGIELQIGELEPAFRWAGPGIQALAVRAIFPDAQILHIDRIMVRPAWSTAWFGGGLAAYVEVDSPSGVAMGLFETGENAIIEGSVENLDLGALAFIEMLPSAGMEGRMDATFSLREGELGPEGPLSIEMRSGSLTIPNMPIALPFDKIVGKFDLGGDAYLTIESLTIEGPIVSGTGTGSIAKADSFERAPLRMDFEMNVKPALAGGARAAGLRVDRKGNTTVRIGGTVSNPSIQ